MTVSEVVVVEFFASSEVCWVSRSDPVRLSVWSLIDEKAISNINVSVEPGEHTVTAPTFGAYRINERAVLLPFAYEVPQDRDGGIEDD
ncbi:hypothetical protein AAIM60_19095 [Pseudomonas lijiangensis]|uniref:hypothetical protein n=1 Tax=Pseudomonas lijiangensis TaxID=2995658 RepID=UPI0031BBB438